MGACLGQQCVLGQAGGSQGDGLSGLPCVPGTVEGRVVRVLDPNQAGDIDGAIMVAYRTDPGWVPLFPRIAALVVERGSLLSHSAVVAREMGIPCGRRQRCDGRLGHWGSDPTRCGGGDHRRVGEGRVSGHGSHASGAG